MMKSLHNQKKTGDALYPGAEHTCEADDGLYATHKPGKNASDGVNGGPGQVSSQTWWMNEQKSFWDEYSAQYRNKSLDCKEKTKEWREKACECDEAQTDFEQDFCEWRNNATEMCCSYHQCRVSAETQYNETKKNNAETE